MADDIGKINRNKSKSGNKGGKGSYQKGNMRKLNFLRLGNKAVGKKFTLRPVGKIKAYYKYIVENNTPSKWGVAVVAEEDKDSNPIVSKHNKYPKETFAVNVINRDTGELQILEGPQQIFEAFGDYYERESKTPGSYKNGADFKLTVNGLNQKDENDKNLPYYHNKFVKQTPLSQSEIEEIEENGGLFDLDKILKPTPVDELEEKLGLKSASNGDPDEDDGDDDQGEVFNRMKNPESNDNVEDDDIPF